MKKSTWSQPMDLRAAANAIAVELRGEEGQPFCCGERMHVGSGILGPDIATCQKCDAQLANMASPHVNGGFLPDPERVVTGETWCAKPGKMGKR